MLLRLVVCDAFCVACDVFCVACDVFPVVCDVFRVVCGVSCATCEAARQMTYVTVCVSREVKSVKPKDFKFVVCNPCLSSPS